MIQVKVFYAYNELRNFSYLIFDDESLEAWVIDPYDADPITDSIKKTGLKLRGILNTHHHHDHIRGNGPLAEMFKSPIIQPKGSDTVTLGKTDILSVLDTPGHTLDHQVFVWKSHGQEKALFSGDTLFNAGVGNCKNGGKVEALYETTRGLIKTLSPETLLYPGHDYIKKNLQFAQHFEPDNRVIRELLKRTEGFEVRQRPPMTLGDELSYNPFLRLDSEQLKQNLNADGNSIEKEPRDERHLFYQLRALRDQW